MTDSIDDPTFHHRSARSWLKVVVEVDSAMTEAVGAFLADLSDGGIEISSGNEPAVVSWENDKEKLTAYIPADSHDPAVNNATTGDIKEFCDSLVPIFPDCSPPEVNFELIKEEDWGRVWKSFFSTFEITPMLTIKPTWEQKEEQQETDEKRFVIEMDPGLAFGTGHHASTQLALLLIEEIFQDRGIKPGSVLDVGTGSGILAMACGLYGAAKVLAIDNDPDAVATARGNITRNLLEQVTVSDQNVESLSQRLNLIVANITHDTLAEMADTLPLLLEREGFMVLSGILKDKQEKSICDIYTGKGMRLVRTMTKEEWAALLLQKD